MTAWPGLYLPQQRFCFVSNRCSSASWCHTPFGLTCQVLGVGVIQQACKLSEAAFSHKSWKQQRPRFLQACCLAFAWVCLASACQHLLGAANGVLTGRRAAVQCVDQLELVFSDADQVAQANLMSSVTQVSAPPPGAATQSAQASNVAVSMFDDDLDLGATSTTAGPNR